MKIINKYAPFFEIEVEAETAKESLYEVGQFIEICIDGEYRDCLILRKDGKRFYVKR